MSLIMDFKTLQFKTVTDLRPFLVRPIFSLTISVNLLSELEKDFASMPKPTLQMTSRLKLVSISFALISFPSRAKSRKYSIMS